MRNGVDILHTIAHGCQGPFFNSNVTKIKSNSNPDLRQTQKKMPVTSFNFIAFVTVFRGRNGIYELVTVASAQQMLGDCIVLETGAEMSRDLAVQLYNNDK